MTDIIPPHEKIRTQMSEHATLRAEIIARTGHGYQLLGFGLAGIAIVVSKDANVWAATIYVAGVVALVVLAGYFSWFDIKKCAKRIRTIEIDVNDRAQEDLIVWENLNGEGALGFLNKAEPELRREHLQSLDPPRRTFRGFDLPRQEISN